MNLSFIVLISLACMALTTLASPIQIVEANLADSKTDITAENSLVGRQTAAVAAAPVAAEEDDDDDEEDDIEDALDDDDDDDDDEEGGASDDDDDDDDDYLERFFDDILGGALNDNAAPVPDILINKYNRFVDGIFGRINKILKRSYDPVSVRLSTTKTKLKTKSSTMKKRKTTKRTKTSQKSRTPTPSSAASRDLTKNENHRVKRDTNEGLPSVDVGIPNKFVTASSKDLPSVETRIASSTKVSEKRVTKRTKTKSKQTKPVGIKKQAEREGAHGVLYGLATLARQGNVRVNVMADYTTVKSNFILGPLVLKVEKAFGRGAKRELKSATATTTEMIGRINLRIVNGAATLHSIKVQQPKQVQVDSADNHDKTRKFVWKKSSHIAQVVSQQLTSAARSMLLPPPSTSN